jgi:Domain of unknown function (DUF4421)
MNLKFLYFLFISMFINCLRAQSVDTNYIKIYDPDLVISYDHVLTRPGWYIESNYNKEDIPVDYLANSRYNPTINLDLDKFTLFFSYTKFKPSKRNLRRFGETKSLNFGGSLTLYNVKFEAYYRYVKGFYDRSTALYPQFDTLNIFEINNITNKSFTWENISLKATKLFNKRKFTLHGAYNTSRRQIKSAGSFLVSSAFQMHNLNADSSLLPKLYNDTAKASFFNRKSFSFLDFNFSLGYTYSFVLKNNFLINLYGTLGPQFLIRKTDNKKISFDFGGVPVNYVIHGSLVYNTRRFFMSANIKYDERFFNVSDDDFSFHIFTNTFSIGYRFPTKNKGFMKKMRDIRIFDQEPIDYRRT